MSILPGVANVLYGLATLRLTYYVPWFLTPLSLVARFERLVLARYEAAAGCDPNFDPLVGFCDANYGMWKKRLQHGDKRIADFCDAMIEDMEEKEKNEVSITRADQPLSVDLCMHGGIIESNGVAVRV